MSSSPPPAPPVALSLNDENDTKDKDIVTSPSSSSKRRKIDDNSEAAAVSMKKSTAASFAFSTAASSSSANVETIDVANMLGVKPGDRIEVKWNINEEEDEDVPPAEKAVEGERLGLPKTEGEEPAAEIIDSNNSSPAPSGMISVWWKATVQKATGEYHILDDTIDEAVVQQQQQQQQRNDSSFKVQPPVGAMITSTDKLNQTYNCPKCSKQNMSKQGLYTHYGMVHGGKLSRDYPNLLSQQQQSSNNAAASTSTTTTTLPKVRIPIYEIIYDPLPSLGFPEYSHEEVAFISNVTLLNLSSEEMMNFRKEGELMSPLVEEDDGGVVVGVGEEEGEDGLLNAMSSSGALTSIFGTEATTTTTTAASKPPPPPSTNPNNVYKEFRTEDDIRNYMNELMQKSMMTTGMNVKMAALPRSQQNVIAGRINKALEGLLGKMMEEMGRMEGGQRVVTGEVVRRCMEQMRPV